MDTTYKYTIKIEPDEDGGYDVAVPALPGCFTWGRTYEEAVAMAREAIGGYIETLIGLGRPIPVESQGVEGGFLVLDVTDSITA